MRLALAPLMLSVACFGADPKTADSAEPDPERGADGTDGADGADGADGVDGTDGADGTSAESCDLSEDEWTLFDLLNAYRANEGLPAVPCSPSLSQVARTHSVDLTTEQPHAPAACNLHSWSDAGAWTGCCYTSDHAQAACMWDKPRELTDYPGNGFEISYASSGGATPAGALAGWQGSPGHDEVIRNAGVWADFPWGAMGVGIDGAYANVWFGVEADPAGR